MKQRQKNFLLFTYVSRLHLLWLHYFCPCVCTMFTVHKGNVWWWVIWACMAFVSSAAILLLLLLLLAFVLCVGSFICTLNAFHFVAISLAIIANNEYHNYTLLVIENAIFLHIYSYVCMYVTLCWCLLFVYMFVSFFMCAFSIKCMLVYVCSVFER